MIDGDEEDGFTLYCDNCGDDCGDDCGEVFETFREAVDYKVDRENGWASVKDKYGEWQELCPTCNTPEIIAKLKGREMPSPRDESAALELALRALEE